MSEANITYVPTTLYAEGTEKLNQEVQKELDIPDPSPSDSDQNKLDKEEDDEEEEKGTS